ncbi:MAG: prenyltransferase [Candidatus Riflebacteria bacterium]|nr:prenyltransferase [Candidatus Riflebacteria bacterium]
MNKIKLDEFLRALRLPFVTACLFPYFFGVLRSGHSVNWFLLTLGAIVVGGTHLSANLINDVADAKSGADNFDKRFFGFFGGSKLIQEGRLSVNWYFLAAIAMALCAGFALLLITLKLGRWETPILFAVVIGLAWQYSCKPLAFAYRGLGEFVVFGLFGPAALAGGVFFSGAGYPTLEQWLLSCIFGFLTAGILIANEVPDAPDDLHAGKRNLVVRIGRDKGWLLFAAVETLAWVTIVVSWYFGYLGTKTTLASFLGFPLAFKATSILRQKYEQKEELVISSKLGIATQGVVSVILILGELF